MRREIIWMLGLLLKAQVVLAIPVEQKAIETFDAYCVQNIDDYGNIAEVAESMGAQKLPPEMIPAGSTIKSRDGGSYIVSDREQSFLIGFKNGGNCTLEVSGLSDDAITLQLSRFYRAKLLHEMDDNKKYTGFYIITAPGSHQGRVLTLALPKPEAKNQAIAVTILSEEAVSNIVSGG